MSTPTTEAPDASRPDRTFRNTALGEPPPVWPLWLTAVFSFGGIPLVWLIYRISVSLREAKLGGWPTQRYIMPLLVPVGYIVLAIMFMLSLNHAVNATSARLPNSTPAVVAGQVPPAVVSGTVATPDNASGPPATVEARLAQFAALVGNDLTVNQPQSAYSDQIVMQIVALQQATCNKNSEIYLYGVFENTSSDNFKAAVGCNPVTVPVLADTHIPYQVQAPLPTDTTRVIHGISMGFVNNSISTVDMTVIWDKGRWWQQSLILSTNSA